jgi:transcriptional regulator with GAF, ATPase, and Fis domain
MSIRNDARFQLLYDLGCAFAARIDLDELVPLVIDRCREVFGAEGASVLLLDESEASLFFPYAIGRDAEITRRLRSLRFPAGEGLAGRVLRSGAPEKVDQADDDRLFREIDRLTGTTTRNLIAAPLRTRHRSVGVLEVLNRHDGSFSDDDLAFLAALAGGVAVALENATLYARVKESEELLRAEVGALRRDLERRERFEEIVGSGEAMAEVFRLMESAAASPISVLVEGETGTGKELIARSIHRASERAAGPFIPVNCAALPETLLESELFGHRRGSFTGALQDRRGLFEAAGGGTIFLDEVGEMPAVMQAKLLRVLQEGEIVPVGENRPRRIDVRVISATNRDLRAEVEERRFREDLYYRLAQFPIWIPPLRERREDVAPIADRLLAAAARRHRKRIPGIDPDAMAILTASSWPGNVRQLQNEIARAVALAGDGERVGVRHLSAVPGRASRAAASTAAAASVPAASPPSYPAPSPTSEPGADPAPPTDLRTARESFEIAFVIETLRREGGNVTRAARALGLSRVMLQRKMKHHGLR